MQSTEIEIQASKEHCIFCFDVLLSQLKKESPPSFPQNLQQFESPVFITFHINGEDLRGCIGTFSTGPIDKQLTKYTIQSAFKDNRFQPIKQNELDSLDVAVSLLVKFSNNKKWDQWEIGVHGIIIDFQDDKGNGIHKYITLIYNDELEYGATFLPEVAAEQGWNKVTTIKYLIRKSGYNRNHESVLDKIKLTTYESSKHRLTYLEYKMLKIN